MDHLASPVLRISPPELYMVGRGWYTGGGQMIEGEKTAVSRHADTYTFSESVQYSRALQVLPELLLLRFCLQNVRAYIQIMMLAGILCRTCNGVFVLWTT